MKKWTEIPRGLYTLGYTKAFRQKYVVKMPLKVH